MIKLLHAADLHLDSAFSALSAERAALRRRAQRQMLVRLTEAAKGCDLVLLAGDLFDSAGVYRDTIDVLRECFAAIDAPVCIAPGNHDFLAPGSPYLSEDFGKNVHIFRSAQPERFETDTAVIYGAAFTAQHMPPLGDFCAEVSDKCVILLLHGDLQSNSPYRFVEPSRISGVDYLALGHIHRRHEDFSGSVKLAWPGCPMGRGFDECGQKGVLRISLDKAHCESEFVPIADGRYEILEVEVKSNPFADICAALPADTANDCYRIILHGQCDAPDLGGLHAALDEKFFALQLLDRTVPARALWDGCADDTLRGAFLRNMKQRYEGAQTPEEQRSILRALHLTLDLMDGREVPL